MIKKLFIIIAILLPLTTSAAGLLSNKCVEDGSCDLDVGFQIFIDASKWLLGIVGSVALLFFVYGGFMWLTSGGKPDAIDKGKKIMIGTITGIVIVFCAWLVVNFVLSSLGGEKYSSLDKVTSKPNPQTECASKDEGAYCNSALGICVSGECVDRCGKEQETSGKQCTQSSDCQPNTITYNRCAGSSQRVCCIPK